MAEPNPNSLDQKKPSIDPKSGFCSETKTFHSLRPTVSLPPENLSLSFADYALRLLLLSSSSETTLLIDSTTGTTLTRDHILRYSQNLSASLQNLIGFSKGFCDCALIVSPPSFRIPILYFSLISLGIVVAPVNPAATESELARLVSLCKPTIAFATSGTAQKLPVLTHKTVLLDSAEFDSMMTTPAPRGKPNPVEVKQYDTAAILHTSGTTGAVKGAVFSNRNLTSVLAGLYAERPEKPREVVVLYPVPLFHAYGLLHCLKSLVVGETVVLTEKFELPEILRLVREFKVTQASLAPPVVAMMAKDVDGVIYGCDLSSLKIVTSGGVSLGKEVVESFRSRFPHIILSQGYGLTESCGVAFRPRGPTECERSGSVGRLLANCEAKIVDPSTATALAPCMHGELWIRGPMVMKGYIDVKQRSSTTLDSEGWLRTGDYGYIDSDGFLFVIDKLENLIKYKDHQISPAQLEELLRSHPDVIDAAVIPFQSEEVGQVPMALVIRHPKSTLDEVQVMDFVAKQVEPLKKVRRVTFVESIPKNSLGKILRKELREFQFLKNPC